MTEPKTLTPAEALRALADGKKLTREDWPSNKFVHFVAGTLFEEDGRAYYFTSSSNSFSNFTEFTEPAPKVVWVEYLCLCPTAAAVGHTSWHLDGFKQVAGYKYIPTGRTKEV